MPVFEAVLGVTIVIVAFRVLTSPDLFESVVLFIVFGLLMSLAWTRVGATDVALAEAAIGAGLTGALFLNALSQTPRRSASGRLRRPGAPALRVAMLTALVAVALLVGAAALEQPRIGAMAASLAAQLERSGTANPVTAVLLDFRGYDTLLEIVVLVVAVACVWALGPLPPASVPAGPAAGPVLLAFVRVLIPVMGVVAGYLLWIGTSRPGGAFHAGAILGAAGVLLMVAGVAPPATLRRAVHRLWIVAGVLAFLSIALGTMLGGRSFLDYPPAWAPALILVIEAFVSLSIAAVLIALFSGGRAPDRHDRPTHAA